VRLFLFLLLMLRRPRSALFPYTTLFRSPKVARAGGGARAAAPGRGDRLGGLYVVARRDQPERLRAGSESRGPPPMGRRPRPLLGDRKSTRLNSSHSQISYAVFCLKKKKR